MAVPIDISIWRTTRTEQTDLDSAVTTLQDTLAPQLDSPVEVTVHDELDLQSDPFDSYQEYLDAFRQAVDAEPGTINVCCYEYFTRGVDEVVEMGLQRIDDLLGDGIPDDVYLVCGMDSGEDETIAEEPPWVGYADSGLQSDEPTYVLVNAVWRELPFVDDVLYENIVMHEVLHPVVGSQNAPAPGDDHSYGTNVDGANSPLLTTYAESYSVNDPPAAGCNQPDGIQECNNHTKTLSPCTTEAVSSYLDEFAE